MVLLFVVVHQGCTGARPSRRPAVAWSVRRVDLQITGVRLGPFFNREDGRVAMATLDATLSVRPNDFGLEMSRLQDDDLKQRILDALGGPRFLRALMLVALNGCLQWLEGREPPSSWEFLGQREARARGRWWPETLLHSLDPVSLDVYGSDGRILASWGWPPSTQRVRLRDAKDLEQLLNRLAKDARTAAIMVAARRCHMRVRFAGPDSLPAHPIRSLPPAGTRDS